MANVSVTTFESNDNQATSTISNSYQQELCLAMKERQTVQVDNFCQSYIPLVQSSREAEAQNNLPHEHSQGIEMSVTKFAEQGQMLFFDNSQQQNVSKLESSAPSENNGYLQGPFFDVNGLNLSSSCQTVRNITPSTPLQVIIVNQPELGHQIVDQGVASATNSPASAGEDLISPSTYVLSTGEAVDQLPVVWLVQDQPQQQQFDLVLPLTPPHSPSSSHLLSANTSAEAIQPIGGMDISLRQLKEVQSPEMAKMPNQSTLGSSGNLSQEKLLNTSCHQGQTTITEDTTSFRSSVIQESKLSEESTNQPQSNTTTTFTSSSERSPSASSSMEDDLVCPLCNKRLSSRHYLDHHVRYYHSSERQYTCTDCGPPVRAFKSPLRLELHRQRLHGVRRHVCSVCGRGFGLASDLSAHKRTHGLGVQFQCDVCQRKFSGRSTLQKYNLPAYLKDHVLTHTLERPYQCTYPSCGLRFRQKKTLTVHYRQHTGERPYKCDMCDKRFFQNSHLKNHLRTNHNQTNSKISKPITTKLILQR